MEQTVNPCTIDVRSSVVDFEAGHIAGAVHLPFIDAQFLSEVKRRYSESDTLFVYCRMGKTSKSAAKLIVANGFQNVYSLKGGILTWETKFPVVTE
jgi:rhodanese-related sulfurtransferase